MTPGRRQRQRRRLPGLGLRAIALLADTVEAARGGANVRALMRRLLSSPRLYSTFQAAIGAKNSRRWFLGEWAEVRAGQRVLDVGCAGGDAIEFLPEVEYVGIDLSERYIEAARRRHGSRGEFHHMDAADGVPAGQPPFDLVMAIGLLHHLTDTQAEATLGLAAGALASGGRFVAFDGAVVAGQPRIARWLLTRDRGEHVRTPEAYRALAARSFGSVELTVRQDLLRIPYTHAMLRAEEPRPVGAAVSTASPPA